CGVFFPLKGLPPALRWAAAFLPLTHGVAVIRPLMTGAWPAQAPLHWLVVFCWALFAYCVATALVRRRLLA
ncbi:MAG TPA: ABC transporter permease, partial [Candidatus Binatia bacterium]|nr:ABC transporter permease [Candidatus Binatia bacterium]